MDMELISKIKYSIDKFNLNLKDKIILTEGATRDYISTPIIADLAGAKRVYAFERESSYGSYEDIEEGFEKYFKYNPNSNIKLIKSLKEIDTPIDIVTNVGLLRPIDEKVLNLLDSSSVITLMYEPWEFRDSDIDLELATKKGIKVYGTNEHDKRLLTMDYIGYMVLYFLLDWRITYFSNKKIVIVGSEEFVEPIERILRQNQYRVSVTTNYDNPFIDYNADIFIIAEHRKPILVLGDKSAYIDGEYLDVEQKVLHICGNVDFKNLKVQYLPSNPAPFGYMSYRTDYIDSMALVDLQTGSLKVAEGMLRANALKLKSKEYKEFMEKNYPALSLENPKYW